MNKTPSKNHMLHSIFTIGLDKKICLTLLIAIIGYALHYLFNLELSHAFSTENYGETQAILSISAFLAHVLLLGNATASVKFIPEYSSTKNYTKLHGLGKYYLNHVFLTCLVAFIILFSFSFFIRNFTWHPFNFTFDITWQYLWIMPIFALLGFFYEVLRSLNAPISSLLSYKIFPNFLFILGLEIFRNFFGIISIEAVCCMYSIILVFVIFGQIFKINQLLDKRIFTAPIIKADPRWFPTGIQLLIAIILIQNQIGIVNLMLKLFGEDSASSIAVISVVYVLTTSMWISYTTCASLLDSSITPDAQAKNTSKLQSIVNKGNSITFFFALLIFCIFVFFGKTLLGHFGEFYVSGYIPLLIVAGGNLIALSAGLASDLLEYALNPKELIILNLGGGAIIIIVGSLLVYFYGLYGAAITLALIQGGLTILYGVTLRKRLNLRAFSIF